MYDSLVAARPSRPHRLPAGLRRHLLQHSLTRHSLCCYTKARDRSNVVNPAVNTHHGGVLSHTVAGCLIFFFFFFFLVDGRLTVPLLLDADGGRGEDGGALRQSGGCAPRHGAQSFQVTRHGEWEGSGSQTRDTVLCYEWTAVPVQPVKPVTLLNLLLLVLRRFLWAHDVHTASCCTRGHSLTHRAR